MTRAARPAMRLNAYVLAGDPAWIAESLGSYYPLVERIVVSYDRSHRSWSGHPLSVEESLRRISALDPEGKVVLLPGDHVAVDRSLMATETAQRQAALDAASEGADWVLQLDTDEVLPAPGVLLDQLAAADARGAGALDFPLRNLYAMTEDGRFLEQCGRFWTTQAAYPGPVAVRAGTALTVARQARGVLHHRVDVAPRNTDPAHPRNTRVDAVIPAAHAVLHLSWVRTEEQMREKRDVSGYAANRDWDRDLARWRWRAKHPLLTTAAAPVTRRWWDRYRLVAVPRLSGSRP
ncbi:hypothetical protein [Agromyces binzhouensis]|uniref:Glycosyltransferase family 2 protein n=1 Tax=Agromyces binzhouensis TaxID=1817495 RepID=A0A4Q2JSY6_9MICO|nr:hypothetical protein [Agromyces binzhouensis]RXZ50146.1 hypothetical protein ESO86_03470 [Agromyces binzhouensis]